MSQTQSENAEKTHERNSESGFPENIQNDKHIYGPGNYKKTDNFARANIFSKLFFCWMFPTFVRGSRRDLDEGDLREPRNNHLSNVLGDRLELSWFTEIRTASVYGRQPSYLKALMRTFWKELMPAGLTTLAMSGLRAYQPVMLCNLVAYFIRGSQMSRDTAMWYGLGVAAIPLVTAFLQHHSSFLTLQLGMKIRIASASLMYRKIMRMTNTALGVTAAGKVANLLTNDINRFEMTFLFIHYLWITPIQLAVIGYLMYEKAGASSLIGFVVIIMLTLPFQAGLASIFAKCKRKVATRTESRVKLINEVISGIQVIKMYAWEKPFDKLVSLARSEEIKFLVNAVYFRGVFFSLLIITERTALFVTLLAYTLMGYQVNAAVVYSLAQFFNIMQETVAMRFPVAITFLSESLVTMTRIQKFLLQDERADLAMLPSTFVNHRNIIRTQRKTLGSDASSSTEVKHGNKESITASGIANTGFVQDKTFGRKGHEPGQAGQAWAIEVREVTARWSKDVTTPCLNSVSTRVRKSKLYAVVGPVGSGKSTLLKLFLRELQPESGLLTVDGTISYASQEPWLYAATVRDNILFGLPYDQNKYKEVCRVCCLEKDFKKFLHGDQTLVGEKGVSLSGGQRARVNLARAVYREADIYLLDDPLSAVDAHVGRQLFDTCITGYLRNKTRVLVTHQLHYLKAADYVIVLNNGGVDNIGTFDELVSASQEFTHILSDLQEGKYKDVESHGGHIKKEPRTISISGRHNKADGLPQRTVAETRASRGLKWKVVSSYFGAAGGIAIGFMLFMMLLGQLSATGIDYWLTYWVNQVSLHKGTVLTVDSVGVGLNEKVGILTTNQYLYVYGALVVSCTILMNFRVIVFTRVCMSASNNLHQQMFSKMMRGAMRFFDTSSSGRILNRFCSDVGVMDERLPRSIMDTFQNFLLLISILSLNATALVWTLLPTSLVFAIFCTLMAIYTRTVQAVRRLEATTKSPVFTQINTTLDGISTIRSAGAQKRLIREFDAVQDFHTSAFIKYLDGSVTLSFWIDIFCTIYLILIISVFLFLDSEIIAPGNVGLAISQTSALTGVLQYGVRTSAEMLSQTTSVERVLEYANIEPERNLEQGETETPTTWPTNGDVTFKNVSLKHGPNDPYVLKDLTLDIKSGWKVGIVGRTGAGKSSLISALFRLANSIEGDIIIDGVNTKTISKVDLRSKVSIIPQEPVLFSATLRYNLDPFDLYSDDDIWKALEAVDLKDAVPALDFKVSEGGANFSLGQRQLWCLARAILRSNKVLVLNEATANVDPKTDSFIQETIRRRFRDCTVLTVAHRLNTIMDSDRVLVLSSGKLVEFDHPHILLNDNTSHLSSMVRETGNKMAEQLQEMAKEAYESGQDDIIKGHQHEE